MTQEQAMLRIQRLRRDLEILVAIRGSLKDREVLKASSKLDAAVNAYYRILFRRNQKMLKPFIKLRGAEEEY